MTKDVIDAAVIDAARAALRDLPPKRPDKLTKRDAVLALKKEIDAMRKKGYDWQDVADKLRELGIDVAAASVRSYLASEKSKAARKEKAGDAPVSTEHGEAQATPDMASISI